MNVWRMCTRLSETWEPTDKTNKKNSNQQNLGGTSEPWPRQRSAALDACVWLAGALINYTHPTAAACQLQPCTAVNSVHGCARISPPFGRQSAQPSSAKKLEPEPAERRVGAACPTHELMITHAAVFHGQTLSPIKSNSD